MTKREALLLARRRAIDALDGDSAMGGIAFFLDGRGGSYSDDDIAQVGEAYTNLINQLKTRWGVTNTGGDDE